MVFQKRIVFFKDLQVEKVSRRPTDETNGNRKFYGEDRLVSRGRGDGNVGYV